MIPKNEHKKWEIIESLNDWGKKPREKKIKKIKN